MLARGALRTLHGRPLRRHLCSGSATSAEANSSASAEPAPTIIATTKSRVLGLWEWYSNALEQYPIRANAATSGALCTMGDVLAQFFEWRLQIMSPDKETYNWNRTARMAFWGTAIGGPVLAIWYRSLHTAAEALTISYRPMVSGRLAWLAELSPATQWLTNLHKPEVVAVSPTKVVLGKVVVDSMLFQAPFLNLYFSCIGALEGLQPSEIVEKTKASFHRVWALSFLVWTPVQAVNLYFVPIAFQPTVVAAVNVGWKTILSLLNHYHDYGSPRSPNPATSQPPADSQPPSQAAAPDAMGNGRGGTAAVAAAGAATWEGERAQLRARIADLHAENRSLRLQLGQLHAASWGAAPPPAGATRSSSSGREAR